ncbi:outer membrane protein assembly factor BamE [Sphingomonas piscis]|uniref:Outer membrane protein assembly factor BamE n=1 Tax=Sphingomonas piscis TaxID=2714943 RepID=A0A6G7YPS5_9SPHN|nr:outer membrane protein assembly factor BamE [Sphingomonas piscis]QIK78742.1 outer membrane protein assembly factor BamE [Sphingomonas piscis]
MKSALLKVATIALGAGVLAGCGGVRAHRGVVLDQDVAAAIQPGVDNKDSVQKSLGRPTFTGQFDANDWYYVSRDTQQLAFRDPSVRQQTVLRVRFDQAGNVVAVNKTGKELVANIDPYGRETPTLGRRRSFFDELFGNIGTVGSGMTPGGSAEPTQ